MKIPKTIKIGAHTFKVLFPYQYTERSDYAGSINYSRNEIRITGIDENGWERAETRVLSTLIHEVLHAIDENAGHMIFGSEGEEEKIEALAEGLTAVLVDNGFVDKEIEE